MPLRLKLLRAGINPPIVHRLILEEFHNLTFGDDVPVVEHKVPQRHAVDDCREEAVRAHGFNEEAFEEGERCEVWVWVGEDGE